jgi:hypothetical protein
MIRAAMQAEGKKPGNRLKKVRERLMAAKIEGAVDKLDPQNRSGNAFGWNLVRSRLGSGLLQGSDGLPPEAYRRSIDRYFELISGALTQLDASETGE